MAASLAEDFFPRDETWVKHMRTQLCPPEMVDQDGNFEEIYFKPRLRNNMLWTEKEEQGLIEGVQEFGVGHWMQIRRSKLREWDEVEIRLKCARLMGRQDLSSYQDWKGDAAQMAQERANNKAKADAGDGVWICGFLTTENLVPQ
jgi:hypothetical protein